jgi:quinol monooxygenase YgiN
MTGTVKPWSQRPVPAHADPTRAGPVPVRPEVHMPFIQIIEFQTDDIDAFRAEVDRWEVESVDFRTATRATLTADRDNPGTFLQVVEFPSYDDAMRNSELPETAAFAEKMMAICDGPPTFRNLDVVREEAL